MNKILIFILIFWAILPAFAGEKNNVWDTPAKMVCDQVEAAYTAYQKGDIKSARSKALLAYFKGYDAEIEPAVRVTLGGPHVFEVEHQFRDYSRAMIANPNEEQLLQVKNLATKLCQAIYTDAKALTDAHIKREVFKVE